MAEPIRVLIADDHAVVREGLRAFLELQEGIEVVGEAADGQEAVEAAGIPASRRDRARPRDAAARRGRGDADPARASAGRARDRAHELPRRRQAPPGASSRRGRLPAQERAPAGADEGGARGPRRRDADRSRRRRPARRDALGRRRRGAARPAHPARARGADPDRARVPEQADRARAGLAEKTVKTHVSHVLAKLGVTDRTQAAVLAVRAGLVPRS